MFGNPYTGASVERPSPMLNPFTAAPLNPQQQPMNPLAASAPSPTQAMFQMFQQKYGADPNNPQQTAQNMLHQYGIPGEAMLGLMQKTGFFNQGAANPFLHRMHPPSLMPHQAASAPSPFANNPMASNYQTLFQPASYPSQSTVPYF